MAEFEAGRRGPSVRSDCWVGFTPAVGGGVRLEVKSKVESMYGEVIRRDTRIALERAGVGGGHVEIEDAGALPFVLAARLEAVVRRAGYKTARLLPDIAPAARRPAVRERFRRSRLYLPGSEPKFMLNAGLHRPDGIILDLEDSVGPPEKDSARILVRNALRVLDFGISERMVRINQLPLGLEDLEEIIPQNVHLILIPKCETREQILEIVEKIDQIRNRLSERASAVLPEGADRPGEVYLMPIIESAMGVLRAYTIAAASPSVVALAIGLEDYTADLGTSRTAEGHESFFARSMVVNAAKAAGVQAIDTVFSDVADMEGLYRSVVEAKSLGFEGKGCIHPRQIEVVHRGFAPDPAEVDKARRIVTAFRAAEAQGEAVVALGNKMIDAPVVKRALSTVRLADMLAAQNNTSESSGEVQP